MFEAARRKDMKVLILEMLRLQPLSNPANRIFKMATTEDPAGASDIAEVIAGDQALSENVLKIANSAYFGPSRPKPLSLVPP